jgi:hypothetical protein
LIFKIATLDFKISHNLQTIKLQNFHRKYYPILIVIFWLNKLLTSTLSLKELKISTLFPDNRNDDFEQEAFNTKTLKTMSLRPLVDTTLVDMNGIKNKMQENDTMTLLPKSLSVFRLRGG